MSLNVQIVWECIFVKVGYDFKDYFIIIVGDGLEDLLFVGIFYNKIIDEYQVYVI